MRRLVLILVPVLLLSIAAAIPADASTVAGLQGPTFGAEVVVRGLEATGQKPESKLFYTHDGRWWAALGLADGVTPGVHLLELTGSGWDPRLRLADSDPWSKADTLYDADSSTLWVSLRDNKASTETNVRRSTLHRLTYDGSGGWSEPDPPVTITTAPPETITIARDSVGRLWTAYEQGKKVKVGYLPVGGSGFTFLTVSASDVAADDIAAVVAYGEPGNGRIGVLWSDQPAGRFMFASRKDTAGLRRTSFTREVAYGEGAGGCPTVAASGCADDHVNLAAVGGTVLAVVKTSLNDGPTPDAGDPLIVMLARTGAVWTPSEVSDVASNFTRPILLTDPAADTVHVFAHVLGDDTYRWSSSLATPSFGTPVPWTVDDDVVLSNPTSTKQSVSAGTGYVVMTSTPKAPYRYWYDLVPGA